MLRGQRRTLQPADLCSCLLPAADIQSPRSSGSTQPDALVAEMMVDGSMVYIDSLAMDGALIESEEQSMSMRPIKTKR